MIRGDKMKSPEEPRKATYPITEAAPEMRVIIGLFRYGLLHVKGFFTRTYVWPYLVSNWGPLAERLTRLRSTVRFAHGRGEEDRRISRTKACARENFPVE